MLMNLENNMSPKCNAKNNVTNNKPNNFFSLFINNTKTKSDYFHNSLNIP